MRLLQEYRTPSMPIWEQLKTPHSCGLRPYVAQPHNINCYYTVYRDEFRRLGHPPRNTMQVPTSLGCPAPLMGVPAPSSSTASSLKDDGWMGVLQ